VFDPLTYYTISSGYREYSAIEIRRNCRHMDTTLAVYRGFEEYIKEVVFDEWPNLAGADGKARVNAMERLIHVTARNKAVYPDFDQRFYKFPSYLRREDLIHANQTS
jgi:hypothetical protein